MDSSRGVPSCCFLGQAPTEPSAGRRGKQRAIAHSACRWGNVKWPLPPGGLSARARPRTSASHGAEGCFSDMGCSSKPTPDYATHIPTCWSRTVYQGPKRNRMFHRIQGERHTFSDRWLPASPAGPLIAINGLLAWGTREPANVSFFSSQSSLITPQHSRDLLGSMSLREEPEELSQVCPVCSKV